MPDHARERFERHDRVRHRAFGEGVVLETNDGIVTVDFGDKAKPGYHGYRTLGGVRKLFVEYAALERVGRVGPVGRVLRYALAEIRDELRAASRHGRRR